MATSERKQTEELMTIRLNLQEFAATHSLKALLQKTLDEVESLTGSLVGFYHFVETDQRTLSLQAWSTRTVDELCSMQGGGLHYSIDQAGVWVDCVHQRRPVIHNDYARLAHRKGIPEGHAPVVRELVVPVFRKGEIVAILGVGNKPIDYTEEDVKTIAYVADVAWEIVERKRAEEETAIRAQQQAAIAELGQLALKGMELDELMDSAVRLMSEVLDLELCKVLELLPDGSALLLRAGVGWHEGLVGHATVGAELESQAGFTLQSKGPVIVEDLGTDRRFHGPPLLHDHGVISGISTIIGDLEKPYGVLGAHTTRRRIFTIHDVHFIQAIAHLLASAVLRKAHEAEIQRMNRLYATLSQVNQTIVRCKSREDLVRQLCRVAVEFGRFKAAWVGLRTGAKEQLTCIARYAEPPDTNLTLPGQSQGCGIISEALETGRPCLSNDAQHDDRAACCRPIMSLAGIRSCAAFPIHFQGEIFGAFCVGAVDTRFFNPEEVHLLEEIAQDISYALEHLHQEERRRQAETALRESRRFLADLIEHSGALVFVKDYEGRYQLVNRKWEEVTGLSRESVIGNTDEMLFSEADARRFRLNDLQAMESGSVLEKEEILESSLGPRYFISIKFPLRDDVGRVVGVCGMTTEITERKRVDAERERLLAAIEQAGESILVTDPKGTIQYVNPAFENVTGYSREEAIGRNPRILNSGVQDVAFYHKLWQTISSGQTWKGRIVNKRKYGAIYTEEATISPVCDTAGRIVNYVAVKRDITEHLRLADQFEQAQKMESVGRLAGGVAHDFNNMLGVILGYVEMAMREISPKERFYDTLTEIQNAARRAADLTRQLLAFARKQTINPKVLDLNSTVEGMLKMLRRLIGEDIDLAWLPGSGLWPVKMDPAQIDQILANLCINARDAIADVGKITIETENTILDEAYCEGFAGFVPGELVMLAISDNGCGMDEESRKRLFEPFFTTKETGKGTGLGLSTVYGIVKQNEGFINVYSEPGRGATFKIYIPRYKGIGLETKDAWKTDLPESRGETVLLVEDEPAMLEIGKRMLESLGYKVLAAGTPREAMLLASEHPEKIDLLMSDVVMPEMNGRELAERLMANKQAMKSLFMSGYTANVIAHHGVLEEGVQFIQKPFSMKDLADTVRKVLDG